MPAVDTLKLKTRLSESGMPESQAQVLVEELDDALSTAITRDTATKADIVELQGAIRNLDERFQGAIGSLDERFQGAIHRLDERLKGEIKLLRWMAGATLPILVGIGIRILFM